MEGKQNPGRSSSFSLVDFEDERYCFIRVSVSGEFNWTVPRFYCSRVISPVFRLSSDLWSDSLALHSSVSNCVTFPQPAPGVAVTNDPRNNLARG
jgi:hypothetical protein